MAVVKRSYASCARGPSFWKPQILIAFSRQFAYNDKLSSLMQVRGSGTGGVWRIEKSVHID